ncbi:argininosuccinate lyase [Trichoderma novae-zelandiae]
MRQYRSISHTASFTIVPGVDEDIFTANERRLGEIVGKDIAGKLHTGRSRNEQVVCDMRMWLRWSHCMLSYGFAFASDLDRLREVIKRVNRNPLGCGALAGNPFGIDRDMIIKELGFDGLIWNSMAGVSDRDFASETLQWGAMFMQHISRWAEDLIIYSTAEFGFKGLPSTYSKGLQESIEPVLDHVKTVSDSAQIANGVLATLTVDFAKMEASLDPFMLATAGIPMNERSFEQLKKIGSRFEEDIAEAFVYETSVERRSAKGGTSKSSVLEQIQVIKAALSG